MSLAGELLSLIVSLTQDISIAAGVGAVTLTLVGHLLSLHAHKNETVFGYVRAARHIRALALIIIIISGGAAILIHVQTGTQAVMLTPAFLFKWLLIVLLGAFYFVELNVEGVKRDAVEGFEGANWYALLIVHTMAPVVGWGLLLAIYAGWLATFAGIWAGFVWLMRRHSTLKPQPAKPAPQAPRPAVSAAVAPAPPRVSKPAPPPAPVPPPAPKPAPMPPAPAVAVQKTLEIHPNHSILPMVAELDLPAPISGVPAPGKVEIRAPNVAPVPAPQLLAPVEIVPDSSKKAAVQMPNLEESGLPALHVMPKRPEDIEGSKRGPVVKMSDE